VGDSVGRGVVIAIDHGIAGIPQLAPGVDDLYRIACANAHTCYLLGTSFSLSATFIIPMTDGVLGTAQVIGGLVQALACIPDGTTCYVVGESSASGNGVVVPLTGSVIGDPETVPGKAYPLDIACPTNVTCYVVGGTGPRVNPPGTIVPLTNGTPGTPRPIASVFEFRHIACAGSGTCYASVTPAMRWLRSPKASSPAPSWDRQRRG
jgi:hypothetical protein